jgi:predicted RNA polymerase sigma factor
MRTPCRPTDAIAGGGRTHGADRSSASTDEYGRIPAVVIRLVGEFHLAEEAVQDAFGGAAAVPPRAPTASA